MPSQSKGKRAKKRVDDARELWERSPSPKEDWGDDAEREFEMKIVNEAVAYRGEPKYEVRWEGWSRADGSNTTWESHESTTEQLPTSDWVAKRARSIPKDSNIELWFTTDVANTLTRERAQGFIEEEFTGGDQGLDALILQMNKLLDEKRRLHSEISLPKTSSATQDSRKPSRSRPLGNNRDQEQPRAGPSRITVPRTQANAEAGPSRTSQPSFQAQSSLTLQTHQTIRRVEKAWRPPAPAAQTPMTTAHSRPLSPTGSVSSSNSIEFLGSKPAPPLPPPRRDNSKRKASSPGSEHSPPPGKRLRERQPLPLPNTPPSKVGGSSRASTSFSSKTLVSRRSWSSASTIHPNSSSDYSRPSAGASPELLSRPLKRKVGEISPATCVCGTLLPPPDMRRMEVCELCYNQRSAKKSGNVRPDGPTNVVRNSTIKVALPTRKGKEKEVKSRRLLVETAWSANAAKSNAAGITFVNEVDSEEVPPTLSGDGWEFTYLEEDYHLPASLKDIPTLDYEVDSESGEVSLTANDRMLNCDCGSVGGAECLDATQCLCQGFADEAFEKEFAYTDGLFNFKYVSSRVVIECGQSCDCSTECPNRVTQRPRKVPIEVFKTKNCGWGVRAPIDVPRGQVLGIYTGKLIPRKQAEKLSTEEKDYCFDLDYCDDGVDIEYLFSVDSSRCGNWTRFINHSCSPNLRVQPVVYDTIPQQNVGYLVFIALEPIAAGTEFTFDYDPAAQREAEMEWATEKPRLRASARQTSRAASKGPPGAKECVCGSTKCRGWVRTS